MWRETTLTRVLQPNSNHSWSDVDWPLEGDLILPIIARVWSHRILIQAFISKKNSGP